VQSAALRMIQLGQVNHNIQLRQFEIRNLESEIAGLVK
jgi:hypothetical protein